MRALKLTILSFVLAAGFGGSAHADAVWASHVGGTCVPDSATIRAAKYETAGFGVRFANGVGAIRLLCPFGLDGYDATIGGMQLSVIDQDGGGADGHIRASLRRAVKGTNVWIEVGSCDSNTSNKTGPQMILCPIDGYRIKGNEWYWWDVLIERSSERVNVEFLGVSLLYQSGSLPWPW
jgi:hypothetical protein